LAADGVCFDRFRGAKAIVEVSGAGILNRRANGKPRQRRQVNRTPQRREIPFSPQGGEKVAAKRPDEGLRGGWGLAKLHGKSAIRHCLERVAEAPGKEAVKGAKRRFAVGDP